MESVCEIVRKQNWIDDCKKAAFEKAAFLLLGNGEKSGDNFKDDGTEYNDKFNIDFT